MLEEYRPEAASLSADVFDALQSAVDSLVDGGKFLSWTDFRYSPTLLDGKVEDAALIPLVFVAHLVEELSIKSPFINGIGCEQSAIEGTSNLNSFG